MAPVFDEFFRVCWIGADVGVVTTVCVTIAPLWVFMMMLVCGGAGVESSEVVVCGAACVVEEGGAWV
jgi:hypothetical protein